MTDEERLGLRYAVACEPGEHGPQFDKDAAYAGPHLLMVAAGMEHMSSPASPANLAIDVLRPMDRIIESDDLTGTLERATQDLQETFRRLLASDPRWEMTGAYLTAMLWQEGGFVVAHAGSTRAYLFRDGRLAQITKDHTVGQMRIDAGEITVHDLALDSQNSLVVRYFEGASGDLPDIYSGEVLPGDRYIICTDSIQSVLETEALLRIVRDIASEPSKVADEIVARVDPGGVRSLTAVVADVVDQPVASTQVELKFAGPGMR